MLVLYQRQLPSCDPVGLDGVLALHRTCKNARAEVLQQRVDRSQQNTVRS